MRRFTRSLSGGVSNCSREFLFKRAVHASASSTEGVNGPFRAQNSEDVVEVVNATGSSMSAERCVFLGFVGCQPNGSANESLEPRSSNFKRENVPLDHALVECNRIRSQPSFHEGLLLRSVENKAMFPFMHFSFFSTDAFDNPALTSSFESNSHSSFGSYEELYYIQKSTSFVQPSLPIHRHSGFIVSCFKILDQNGRSSQLEKSWLTWTGAQEIYKYAPRVWNLRRLSLFRLRDRYAREQTHNFAYVLVCEFGNILHPVNTVQALDMTERLRARNCGQIGLYQVQHSYGPGSTIPMTHVAESRLRVSRTSSPTVWPAPHPAHRFESSPTRQTMARGFSQDVTAIHEATAVRRRPPLGRIYRDRSVGYENGAAPFRSYQQFQEFT